jgi:hypothetical protein
MIDGQRSNARFGPIQGLAMESDGSLLYVADTSNGRIRTVRVSSGEVATFAGSVIGSKDGIRLTGLGSLSPANMGASSIPTTKCSGTVVLTSPEGWLSDGPGNYDAGRLCGWVISAAPNQVVTLQFAMFETEQGFDAVTVFDVADQELAVLSGSLYYGLSVTAIGGMRVRFKADMSEQAAGFAAKYSIGLSSARSFGVEAMQIGDLASALVQPVGLACLGRKLYFTESGMSRLRFVDLDTGFVSTLVHSAYGPGARDGPINCTSAYVSLREPIGLAGSSKGVLYIADSSNRMIRELKLAQSQLLSGNITWMSSMSTSPMG